MSVRLFEEGDRFIIRTKKTLTTNPDNSWVNSYELVAIGPGSEGMLLAAGEKLVAFEALLSAPAVRISQLTVSTWEADSVPYDPESFISTPMAVVGTRTKAVDVLSLNQCWGVTRIPQFGRFGHLFLRGCLYEDDVTAPAGRSVFQNLSAIALDLEAAISTSDVADLFGAEETSVVKLAMISKDGSDVRRLLGFSVGGVSAVPQDHAWFNRTSPTP